MTIEEPGMHAVLAQTARSFEPWMSCDACFDRSDIVLEDLLDRDVPLPDSFRAHLAGCAACRDEMETLAELSAVDRGLDPHAVRDRVDAQIVQP
jgi:hypothetical protein